MNDCVFVAYQANLDYLLKVRLPHETYLLHTHIYHGIKCSMVGRDDMFPATAVPYLIKMLCSVSPMGFDIEYALPFDRAFWYAHANTDVERTYIDHSPPMKEGITTGPGIYLPMYWQHAIFSTDFRHPAALSIKLML